MLFQSFFENFFASAVSSWSTHSFFLLFSESTSIVWLSFADWFGFLCFSFDCLATFWVSLVFWFTSLAFPFVPPSPFTPPPLNLFPLTVKLMTLSWFKYLIFVLEIVELLGEMLRFRFILWSVKRLIEVRHDIRREMFFFEMRPITCSTNHKIATTLVWELSARSQSHTAGKWLAEKRTVLTFCVANTYDHSKPHTAKNDAMIALRQTQKMMEEGITELVGVRLLSWEANALQVIGDRWPLGWNIWIIHTGCSNIALRNSIHFWRVWNAFEMCCELDFIAIMVKTRFEHD